MHRLIADLDTFEDRIYAGWTTLPETKVMTVEPTDTPPRLVYGLYNRGFGFNLLVLDEAVLDRVYEMGRAATWGEAFRDHLGELEAINAGREESDEPPHELSDPFDFDEEANPEYGVVYLISLDITSRALTAIRSVLRPGAVGVESEYGMVDWDACFLRDDEVARSLERELKQEYGPDATLVRDDDSISSFQWSLLN